MNEEFYIQNEGYCGNCLHWWRPNGHGYTDDLNEAWKVSREVGEQVVNGRRPQQDWLWLVSEVDAASQRHLTDAGLRKVKDGRE